MHIAGVLVQTHPHSIPDVEARLGTVAGLEVHTVSPDGRMVVTIEGEGRKAVADALFKVHAVDGVLAAALVYEESETES